MKAVRDQVPNIVTRVAEPQEWVELITAKLTEEMTEYLESGDPMELADLVEVAYAVARTHGVNLSALRADKNALRGAFIKHLVWDGS